MATAKSKDAWLDYKPDRRRHALARMLAGAEPSIARMSAHSVIGHYVLWLIVECSDNANRSALSVDL